MGYFVKRSVCMMLSIGAVCLVVAAGFIGFNWDKCCSGNHLTTSGDSQTISEVNEYSVSNDYNNMQEYENEKPTRCDGPEWECNMRLSEHVFPIHYDLYLNPDIDVGVFKGHITLQLNVTKAVDHVRLHLKNLNVTHTTLYDKRNGRFMTLNKSFEYAANEYWVVKPEMKIAIGTYLLHMEFKGDMTKRIVGFYRSEYFDKKTKSSRYVVSSKFQPTYARRAFPCMDEPGFKSTFSVTLVKPSQWTALSNMPVKSEDENSPQRDFTTVHFEKSVPMVTYLVVFAIGDFAYTEGRTKRGIPVRVYSTKYHVRSTEYATSITPDIIDFFEEYFDIKYPLPKLDIIGIPDFVSGAMEHWGLISFRETNLLWQRGVASAANKQRITTVISHELAHMWFGNLMTLKWWDDLWINEGFASYMEYKGVNAVYPDWEMEQQFVGDDLTLVLKLDGRHSSHPIVQTVSSPDQITELFDTISYSKGASVIRMLENFVGKKKFQKGISQFLKKYSFKNAITNDLWTEIQKEVEDPKAINISLIMDTWTRQMGYPIITPQISRDGKLMVKQERFIEGNMTVKSKETPFGYKWDVPLQIFWQDSNAQNFSKLVWIPHNKESIEIPDVKNWKWFTLNSGQFGYYRVNYSMEMLQQLKDKFQDVFSPKERCALIDDLFSLATANYIPYDAALDFAQVLKSETHYVPWMCSDSHFKRIGRLLMASAPSTYGNYQKYIISLVTTAYNGLTWTDDESDRHLDRLMKPRIFSLACKYGMQNCLDMTKNLFDEWIASSSSTIPPGLRDVVYTWGIWQSGERAWNIVWKRYQDEADPQEKIRLLKTLASSQEPWILRSLLDRAKNEKIVRRQDFFSLVKFVAANPNGNSVAWSFYRTEYQALVDRFTINDRYFGRILLDIVADYSTDVQLREMQTLFKKFPNGGAGTRSRQSAYENVQNNILWKEQNAPTIEKWLSVNF